MALYSFRHDAKKHSGAFAFKCSPNTYWESVDMTINVLHEHMVPEWIMLPTPDEARQQRWSISHNVQWFEIPVI